MASAFELHEHRRNILLFLVLAYGGAWVALLPLIATGSVVKPGIGWPTHLPALVMPAVAAIVAAALSGDRNAQLADLRERVLHLPGDLVGWMIALSPLAIGALICLGLLLSGEPPDLSGLQRYSGVPEMSAFLVLAVVFLVNGLGEELGWRGYLLPRLQARHGALRGTALSALAWAGWHAPMFLVLASYLAMDPPTRVFGFGLGILCGALVLAHVTARAGGSVGAAALWHTLYNMAAATALGGLVPAAITTVVMIWGFALVGLIALGRLSPQRLMLPAPSLGKA